MATDNSGPGFGGTGGSDEGQSGGQGGSVGFGGEPGGDASAGGSGYGGVDDTGGRTRRTFKDQVTVSGEYGSETVRRKDEPDVGYGKVHAVVTFDGVLDYEGDTYFGNVSVDEDRMDELVGDVKGRVRGYDVVPFVKGGSDE
jgi:hypothetical protein